MKQSGICPKCASMDILLIPGYAGAYGSGNYIPVGWTNLSAVKVNRYLCCCCGYSEEWIDKGDIPALVSKYKKRRTKRPRAKENKT